MRRRYMGPEGPCGGAIWGLRAHGAALDTGGPIAADRSRCHSKSLSRHPHRFQTPHIAKPPSRSSALPTESLMPNGSTWSHSQWCGTRLVHAGMHVYPRACAHVCKRASTHACYTGAHTGGRRVCVGIEYDEPARDAFGQDHPGRP